jgi:2-hydroxy-6-oxonona-2,4-dienedioate hydrolase
MSVESTVTYESSHKLVQTKDYRIQINEAGEGHPIFLIHGGGPGATGWSNYAANIGVLSRKYRCIAVTMPGWGESSPQNVETGRNGAEALKQLAEAMGIEKAAYVGNSMGGAMSVEFTARYPARVSHLITMGLGNPEGKSLFQPAGPS